MSQVVRLVPDVTQCLFARRANAMLSYLHHRFHIYVELITPSFHIYVELITPSFSHLLLYLFIYIYLDNGIQCTV